MRERLGEFGMHTQPNGFHCWLPLPEAAGPESSASAMANALRELGIAAVAASAFSTDRQPPEGLRLCLGGGLNRDDCGRALQAVVAALGERQST